MKRMLFWAGLPLFLLSLALVPARAIEDEFCETLPDGTRPPVVSGVRAGEAAFAGAARQSTGALSGRIVFTCAGHGWTWGRSTWVTQRGVGREMNEDYGNLDQMNCFVPYVFNAGATVVALRPVGYQVNEVVLDNTSPGVRFSGKWHNSRSPVYFGAPGAVPYRFALLGRTETAKATYTPKLPAAGFYPVYTWVRHGSDRTSQLYRILHTGGETLVRVPHHMVGSGWVYLGTYYFEAGSSRKQGSVIVSNLQPSPGFGAVAVADAIRFGNGMGDVIPVPGGHISTYPREEEASRYWILKSLGQGQTNVISLTSNDQQSSNVSAPPRMARAMNRVSEGNMFKRIYLGFHSNAGGGRGTIGLWNNPELFPGTKTPNQERWAQLIGEEVNSTLSAMAVPPLEVPWFKRSVVTYARNDYAFGEINNKVIGDEFDATILEVAFHDSLPDTKLLRDPKVRDWVGRCSYQAIVRYMNQFDGAPLQFLPEPPQNVRAVGSPLAVSVAWDPPAQTTNTLVAGYVVYRSEDGYGFGAPVQVPAGQTRLMLTGLSRGKDRYFRVTAVNAGGESLPSAVAGCRPARTSSAPRVLVVNGFTEFARFNNLRQTLRATNYVTPSAIGAMDRVVPRLNNAFAYVVQYGKALAANGAEFDSCQRESVANGHFQLEGYKAVIWAVGQQTTNLLASAEREAVDHYVEQGGNLLLTGSHIAEILRPGEGGCGDVVKWLHAIAADAPGSTDRYLSFVAAKGSIFSHNQPGIIGDASDESYFINATSRLLPDGPGACVALVCPDGSGTAAVQYDGSVGGGRVVCFGFPFECLASAKTRARYMERVLRFFDESRRKRGG
jgi:hypothetical protein